MTSPIDSLAYTNGLKHLFPQHKLIFALVVLLIALFSSSTIQGLIFFWMSIWIVVYAKIPFFIYFKMVLVASLFWLGSLPALVLNAIEQGNKDIIDFDVVLGFFLGSHYFYLSARGCDLAFVIFFRSLATTSCLYFIILTVPFVEIVAVLEKLGFPKIFTELLLLIYRFIFIVLKSYSELFIAQKSRLGYQNIRISFKSLGILGGQLLVRTLMYYQQFSLGLAARGFQSEFNFWRSSNYYFSIRYSLEAILGCILLIFLSWH